MTPRHSVLDRVAIPISCDADWTEMPGTERVRHCAICDQNVYNLSAMTQHAAEELVAQAGGRLCAKIYRRPDGAILTRNCPPGIRGLSLRLVRRASWMMSVVLGWSPLGAQEVPKRPPVGATLVQIEKSETAGASVTGMVYDPSGAIVVGAAIGLSPIAGSGTVHVRSAQDGWYQVKSLAPGEYAVTISAPGFRLIKKTLTLQSKEAARLDATLDVGEVGGMIIVTAQPMPVIPVTPVKQAKKK